MPEVEVKKRDRKLCSESPEIALVVRTLEQEAGQQDKSVAGAAMKKSDRLCEQTMQFFVEAYGAEVGNLALKLLPYGGLYVAGGIAPKILPLIQEEQRRKVFLSAFAPLREI